jgi:hypothetical protein
MLERAVVGPFGVLGKTAGGELPALQVILKALAADALPGAGFIAAIAVLQILVFFAFHGGIPQ